MVPSDATASGSFHEAFAGPSSIRFSWTTSVRPGESLLGFITRSLAGNYYPATAQALAYVGLSTSYPEGLVYEGESVARAIASAFGEDPDVIRSLMHPRRDGGDDGWIDFFGVQIRSRFREVSKPRVSPLMLRSEPWHHAVWDLRPFTFCPRSLEHLLDHCPGCGHTLTWKRAHGPTSCAFCLELGLPTVDLRDHPQPLIQCEDEEALCMVTSLVSPFAEVRLGARRVLPPLWLSFSDGELFELVIALARVAVGGSGPNGASPSRLRTMADFKVFTPDRLAQVGRRMIEGSSGIASLIEAIRDARVDRPGFFGKRKEMGPLLTLLHQDADLPPRVKQFLHSSIDESMSNSVERKARLVRRIEHRVDQDLTPLSTLARETAHSARTWKRLIAGGHLGAMTTSGRKGPTLVGRRDALAIVSASREAIARHRVAKTLGIGTDAVDALATSGLIERIEGAPLLLLQKGDYYSHTSIDALLERLFERLQPLPVDRDPNEYDLIVPAVRRIAAERPPWHMIFQLIVDGSLPIYTGSAGTSATARMVVNCRRLASDASRDRPEPGLASKARLGLSKARPP